MAKKKQKANAKKAKKKVTRRPEVVFDLAPKTTNGPALVTSRNETPAAAASSRSETSEPVEVAPATPSHPETILPAPMTTLAPARAAELSPLEAGARLAPSPIIVLGPSRVPDSDPPPPVVLSVQPHEAAFFDGESEAVAKLHAEHSLEAAQELEIARPPVVLTPAMAARRKSLRKLVSGVVAVAGVMSIFVGVRAIAASKRTTPTSASMTALRAPDVTTALAAPRAMTDPKAIEAAPKQVEPTPAPALPETKPEVAQDAAPAVDPKAAAELAKKALRALDRGRYKDAIEAAEASVQADPTDANPYLYWGTALLEQGKSKAAHAVFAKCVEDATHGRKAECRQFR